MIPMILAEPATGTGKPTAKTDATADDAEATPFGDLMTDAEALDGDASQTATPSPDGVIVETEVETAELAAPLDDRKLTETDTTAIYAFTPLPDEDADDMQRKVMKKVEAEITLAKEDGAVLAYQASLPKPYKPAMIAKVNTLNIDVACERAPDGRTYIQSFLFELSGSAMMNDFDEKSTRTFTRLIEAVG